MVNGAKYSSTADYNAIWVYFTTPPHLQNISWVKYKSPSVKLKDGNNRDLVAQISQGTAVRVPDWTSNSANWDSTKEHFKAWHKKEGTGSFGSDLTVAQVQAITVGTKDLTFGLEL